MFDDEPQGQRAVNPKRRVILRVPLSLVLREVEPHLVLRRERRRVGDEVRRRVKEPLVAVHRKLTERRLPGVLVDSGLLPCRNFRR